MIKKNLIKFFTAILTLKIFKICYSVLTILAFIYFLRWAGYKGVISLLLGMLIMAYLLLSKNIMFMSLVKLLEAEQHIDDIKEKKDG